MASFTDRDKIWNNALMQDAVTPSHYTEVFGVSEEKAAETLDTMDSLGLLERTHVGDGTVAYSSKVDHPKSIPRI